MTFHIGQKVVCISDVTAHIQAYYPGSNYPRLNSIYTIRHIGADRKGALLTFSELDNSHFIGQTLHGFCFDMEPGFGSEHFRPIVELKTDISVFTRMLTDQKVDA